MSLHSTDSLFSMSYLRLLRRIRHYAKSSGVAVILTFFFVFLFHEKSIHANGCGGSFSWPTSLNSSLVDMSATNEILAKIAHIKSFYVDDQAGKLKSAHQYYDQVMKAIVDAKPACGKLSNYPNGGAPTERIDYERKSDEFTEKHLLLFLQLDKSEYKLMTASHRSVMKNLPDETPEGLYSGDGIVYVGGGRFNWLALLSIKNLRALGCELPVEVFIPSLEEYELEFCSSVLPSLNAKCIHLSTALSGDELKYANQFTFLGYQYKSLAIMLSSFENVLLLDSDNIPVKAPQSLFTQEPFTSMGLIVWPDFWHRTTSPHYFKIAGNEVSKTRILPKYHVHSGDYIEQANLVGMDWGMRPLHERFGAIPNPSSESGQLMISKKTHMKALLLALYYNVYGPGYYYPLLSQGTPGEGDKETFLAATVVLKKPFYQVLNYLVALGNVKNDAFNGNAMGQYDPVEDYIWNEQKIELRSKFQGEAYKKESEKLEKPHMMFVHANTPKLDPWKMLNDQENVDDKGNRYRLYGLGMKERTGSDMEQSLWTHMDELLCKKKLKIDLFKDVNRRVLCHEIEEHLEWLVSTEDTLE